jgi:hypothetical protein
MALDRTAVSETDEISGYISRPQPQSSWDPKRLTLAAVLYHPSLDIARAKLAEAQGAVV